MYQPWLGAVPLTHALTSAFKSVEFAQPVIACVKGRVPEAVATAEFIILLPAVLVQPTVAVSLPKGPSLLSHATPSLVFTAVVLPSRHIPLLLASVILCRFALAVA